MGNLLESHEESLHCVEFAEEFADGTGAKKRLRKLVDANKASIRGQGSLHISILHAASAARGTCDPTSPGTIGMCHDIGYAVGDKSESDYFAQAALLRCIIGNPFQDFDTESDWCTSTVIALASHAYESRDFTLMPILADALQDAGCANEAVLEHCRSDGPHARGCWVVDALLGKT
jgi:hypothetical protein